MRASSAGGTMSENRETWFCTLCNKESELSPEQNEQELRCPHCMRKTGLVRGRAAATASAAAGSQGVNSAKGSARWWIAGVLVLALAGGSVGAWFVWQALQAPDEGVDLDSLVQEETLKGLLDVSPEDPRLEGCGSLAGFAALLESKGFFGAPETDARVSLRPVSELLEGTRGGIPAEGLALGLACIRAHGSFAVPCLPTNVDLTVPMQKQPMGLCAVSDGKATDSVLLPKSLEMGPDSLRPLDARKGAALVLATAGGLAEEPAAVYGMMGKALEIFEDPLIRFQLGEAKVKFKVMDFASEDMAKALAAGYNQSGVMRLAEVQSRMGRWAEALGLYTKVLQESPELPKAKLGKIRSLLGMGRMADAEPLLKELSQTTPDMEELNHILAAWHLANKRGDEALAALRKEVALRPSPGSALALIRTAESVKGAEAAFAELGTLAVAGMEVELEKLRLALILGKREDVVKLAESLAATYPDDANVRRACGLGYFEVQQLDKAELHFDAADKLGGDREFESLTYLTLVRYLMEGAGRKPNESGASTLARLEQRHKNARLDVALSLEGLGQWQLSRTLLEEFLAKDPLKVDAAVALYGLYLRNGDPSRADALRKKTVAALPEAERVGVESGFQHELESVEHPEDTPSSASMPRPAKK